MSTETGLRVEQDGPVVTVTLANPDARNSQTPAFWRELAQLGASIGPDVRVVVLKAEGKSFSAGLDKRMFAGGIPGEVSLAELASVTDSEFDTTIAEFQKAFTWWRESDAITIAAVHGHAVGAGFQLALAADLMVVAENAQLSMRETQLGLVPDLAGTHPLVEAVGYSKALEICLTGRWVDAAEAVSTGIAISKVPLEELDGAVAALTRGIVQAAPGATIETKHLLRGAGNRTRAEQCAAERSSQRKRILDIAAAAIGS